MKKLEELGISPAPWKKVLDEFGDEEAQYQVAVTDARFPVGAVTLSGNYCEADSCLIAAAPELYEGCYELLRYYEEPDTNTTVLYAALGKIKKAMAKASGEGEVAK